MKHKLPFFAVIALAASVGVLAVQTYKANREQASAPQPPPAPSQAFLENVRGELNNVAAGNGAGNTKNIEFSWTGNTEMDEATGDGWAELQQDGTLQGQICSHNGDEADFIAKPWKTSSTAC